MPQRPTPKTKHYAPSDFIECEICGQQYYSGYKQKHEASKRHVLCFDAVSRHMAKFRNIMTSVNVI